MHKIVQRPTFVGFHLCAATAYLLFAQIPVRPWRFLCCCYFWCFCCLCCSSGLDVPAWCCCCCCCCCCWWWWFPCCLFCILCGSKPVRPIRGCCCSICCCCFGCFLRLYWRLGGVPSSSWQICTLFAALFFGCGFNIFHINWVQIEIKDVQCWVEDFEVNRVFCRHRPVVDINPLFMFYQAD